MINVSGIVLAAGTSSRMGENKLLLPFGESTVLENVVENAKNSRLNRIIVIVNPNYELLDDEVGIFVNNNYQQGQSSSVKLGMEHLAHNTAGVMFLLGDQPLISAAIINQLLTVFTNNPNHIILPVYQHKRGNPLIFPKSLFKEIKQIVGDRGCRDLLIDYPQMVLEVNVNSEVIHLDIDTKEDYNHLSNHLQVADEDNYNKVSDINHRDNGEAYNKLPGGE